MENATGLELSDHAVVYEHDPTEKISGLDMGSADRNQAEPDVPCPEQTSSRQVVSKHPSNV